MTEFVALSPPIQEQRDREYVPMDHTSAECVAGYLDEIIEATQRNRSATAGSETTSEWCELEIFLVAPNLDIGWQWPPATLRLQVRRDITHDQSFPVDNYTVILGWQTHRDDLGDPGFTRAYSLMIPHDTDQEEPQLLVCYQPSLTAGAVNGHPAQTDTILSSHHEADTLLDGSFYHWKPGTRYDANQLFDELGLLASVLPQQPRYVWDAANVLADPIAERFGLSDY